MVVVAEPAEAIDISQTLDLRLHLLDRDEGVRDSLKVLLESYGFKIQAFGNRSEFLASAAEAPGHCLILSSNRLIVDGLELLSTLRRRGVATPAIFIVGGGNPATRASALAAGAAAYLERPVAEKALIRAIVGAVQGQRTDVPPAKQDRR